MDNSYELRKKLWLKRNSLKCCENEVIGLLRYFKIIKYNITCGYDDELELILEHNNRIYKIQVEKEKLLLNVLERNGKGNPKQKEKYHLIQVVDNEDCWYCAIQMVKQLGKIKEIRR